MAKALNQTALITPLVSQNIAGADKYAALARPFEFYSATLKRSITVPFGFVFDYESIPFIRGYCPEAGCAHDYLCRTDSNPVVDKKTAAKVYFEILNYIYSLDGDRDRAWEKIKARAKYIAVLYAPGYFHKHTVRATYEEMAGAK